MGRGAFIVFEGADRSGKTTQTQRCVSALESAGVPVAPDSPWRFPDRTTGVGKMIDAYLRSAADLDDHAVHLLFCANRWERAGRIRAALGRGETVVVDRYAYSGVAYSVAKGLEAGWCRAGDAGLPAPDAVVYLELSAERARQRGGYGVERYENEGMQRRVAEAFAGMKGGQEWRVVDADAGVDVVFGRVMEVVLPAIRAAAENGEAGKLWDREVAQGRSGTGRCGGGEALGEDVV